MKLIHIKTIAALSISLLFLNCDDEIKEPDSVEGNELNLEKLTSNITSDENYAKLAKYSANSNWYDAKSLDSLAAPLSTIPTNRSSLNDMRTVVKIYSGNTDAGITIPGFGGVKLGEKEVNLNVYYIETKVINNNNDSIVYGIGYSAHYLFKKVKRGIDLSNLPSIAASVQIESKKTQVYYSLQTYGIHSNNLVRYFKPTIDKNFDVDGFGVMQSSIDGIHNVLGDTLLSKSVKFTPKILKFVKPYELEE